MPRTIATTVAPRALRSIRAGHPWVYTHSIRTQKHRPEPGDLAVVFDDRRFVGIGLADADSPIAIRMLHHGSSTTIDGSFFAARVDDALALRTSLLNDPDTTGYRLINGENDRLPGLIADEYNHVIVVKLYTAAWLPHLSAVVDRLVERRGPAAVVLRASRAVQPSLPAGDGAVVYGALQDPSVRFLENGLHFSANVVNGNKTGHFLDQRDNRQRVREQSRGVRMLDVFSSSGGFSVYAAAGGARSVTAIDISTGALMSARENVAMNTRPPAGLETLAGDAFEQMSRLRNQRRQFDLIVVDPPSFASKQTDIEGGLAAYRRLTRHALTLLADGGLLVQASCSARITTEQFVDTVTDELTGDRRFTWSVFGHASDHPVTFAEGEYLKAVFARQGRATTS